MNKNVKRLVKQSGFALWEKETYRPPGAVIDWACNYDDEFKQFVNLIVDECAELAACNGHVSGFELSDLIRKHFGVKL